jgi:hypothetical protein
MSRSPFARQHLAEASLALAAAFLWMKFCHALFAQRVRRHIGGEASAAWSTQKLARIFLWQSMVQPTGLFILPFAAVLAVPFGWVYAFYQSVTVLGDAGIRDAAKQAGLWPRQNHGALSILIGFGFSVFMNCALAVSLFPQLLKMFLGIETFVTRNPEAMLNTTTFATLAGLTYLCVDPVVKVFYVLRCFYGESRQSGRDLKASLRGFAAAALLVVALVMSWPAHSFAQSVSPEELDRRIDQTIHETKYTWRMPRDAAIDPDAEKGMLGRFMDESVRMVRRMVRTAYDWIRDLWRKIAPDSEPGGNSGFAWATSTLLLYALLAVTVAAVAIVLFRSWKARRKYIPNVVAEAIPATPNLADENVAADQLPEDGWLRLAHEMQDRGDYRLAMRALYLASLAHLAQRNLIRIARFKSNRDYERELGRRAHILPEIVPVFGESVSAFERVWYGTHEITGELFESFASNIARIRTAA